MTREQVIEAISIAFSTIIDEKCCSAEEAEATRIECKERISWIGDKPFAENGK